MTDLIVEKRGLDIGRALGDTFGIVGRRWPRMAAAVLLVAWAPQVLLTFGYIPIIARLGVAARNPWVSPGVTSVILLAALYMRATVTALALDQSASMPRALVAAATAIPALAPLWLVGLTPNLTRVALQQTHISLAQQSVIVSVITWPLAIILTLTLGVFTAVAVSERRGLMGTVARAARR